MSEKKELAVGEKYLTIKIVGHEPIVAFKNKEREGNQPHYRNQGVGVWISTKKEPKKEEPQELDDL